MKKIFRYLLALALACVLATVILAIYDRASVPRLTQEHVQNPTAVIEFKSGGRMEFELFPTMAPNTVASFISLANSGFYDGLDMNLVVAGAFARGGDPAGDGTGAADYTIAGEFSSNGWKANKLSHRRGVISLARRPDDVNSGSCQFFIMQGDYPEFDGQYAAFGRMTNEDGLSLLDEICSSPVDSNGTPIRRWTMKSVRVETYGAEYSFEIYVDPSLEPSPEPEQEDGGAEGPEGTLPPEPQETPYIPVFPDF